MANFLRHYWRVEQERSSALQHWWQFRLKALFVVPAIVGISIIAAQIHWVIPATLWTFATGCFLTLLPRRLLHWPFGERVGLMTFGLFVLVLSPWCWKLAVNDPITADNAISIGLPAWAARLPGATFILHGNWGEAGMVIGPIAITLGFFGGPAILVGVVFLCRRALTADHMALEASAFMASLIISIAEFCR